MEVTKNIEIEDGIVRIDGTLDFSYSEKTFKLFSEQIYKHYQIDYVKFFKMSQLSKLGFLASELLLKDVDIPDDEHEKVSLIIANSSSSLHTDIEYQSTIESVPRPAIFVYTLPNILIGEICIRNGFKGEGTFFIQESFDKIFIFDYIANLFESQRTTLGIAGWIDIDTYGYYFADLYLLK